MLKLNDSDNYEHLCKVTLTKEKFPIAFENKVQELMEECELVCNRNQWYSFADKWGFQKDCSGEIFDFSSKSPDTYFKIENNEFKEFVEWFDIPYDGAERHEFGFIFDRIINSEGKVIALWDRLK